MASQVSIAIERDQAIDRINAHLKQLATEKGHEYAPIPTQGKDQAIVNKNQLVYIADTLDAILGTTQDTADTQPNAAVQADDKRVQGKVDTDALRPAKSSKGSK